MSWVQHLTFLSNTQKCIDQKRCEAKVQHGGRRKKERRKRKEDRECADKVEHFTIIGHFLRLRAPEASSVSRNSYFMGATPQVFKQPEAL